MLGRKIREEVKDQAFWSTGLIEVNIDEEKKAKNFEANEFDKRDKILNEISRSSIPEYYKTCDEQDLSAWMYKSKDLTKQAKEKERREFGHFMQQFKREGRHFAREKWMGKFGLDDAK